MSWKSIFLPLYLYSIAFAYDDIDLSKIREGGMIKKSK